METVLYHVTERGDARSQGVCGDDVAPGIYPACVACGRAWHAVARLPLTMVHQLSDDELAERVFRRVPRHDEYECECSEA